MSGIVDCEMHIGDEVFVHGYIDEIRNDTIIIRNVGGYFGTSRDEVFYYKEDGTMNEAEQTENSSEKPNNCKNAKNPSGDVWECGCFLDTYCEHQIYDRNPDGTINIVECGYEPKDEPQTEDAYAYDEDDWYDKMEREGE